MGNLLVEVHQISLSFGYLLFKLLLHGLQFIIGVSQLQLRSLFSFLLQPTHLPQLQTQLLVKRKLHITTEMQLVWV